MKTSGEISDSIAQHVAGIYLRPSMSVGAVGASYSANALESLLFALHYHWSFAHDREKEFSSIKFAQYKAAGCSNFGLTETFRRLNEDVADEDVSRFVMRNWREISVKLEMPLTDRTGRDAIDVEL